MAAHTNLLICWTRRCKKPPRYEVMRSGTDRFGNHCAPHARALVASLNAKEEARES